MNTRLHIKASLTLGVLGASVTGLLISACSIPAPYCTAAYGEYAVKLVKKSGEGACAEMPGEIIGSQSYVAEKNGKPQLDQIFAAFRGALMGSHLERAHSQMVALDPAEDHKAFSFGKFDSTLPNGDDICTIKSLSEALQDLPPVPAVADDPMTMEEDETAPELPASTMSYKWSNIRMRVTPEELGSAFAADLEFSQDDCVATYEAIGVFPPVGCESDADCAKDGNGLLDSYRARAKCDTAFGYCVLPSI